MPNPRAVVLGLAGTNALSTMRSLGYGNVPIIGMHRGAKDNPRLFSLQSKYMEDSYFEEDDGMFLTRLLKYGEMQDEKGVLFCTGDDYLIFCSRHADALRDFYHIPEVPGKNLECLLDKSVNGKLAEGTGFKVPRTMRLSEFNGEIEEPVIYKPIDSFRLPKSGMRVYDSGVALLKDKQKLLDSHGDLAVQEFIPGDYTKIVDFNIYNSSKGPLIGVMQRNALPMVESPNVFTGFAYRSMWDGKIVKATENFMRSVPFSNVLNIGLKQDSSGEYYFMECNFRTGSNILLSTYAGLNLPAIVYYDQTGKDFSHLLDKKRRLGIVLVDEADLLTYFQDNPETDVLASIRGTKLGVFYDPNDMAPFRKRLNEIEVKKVLGDLVDPNML